MEIDTLFAVEFLSGAEGYGVDQKVVMQVLPVQMGGDQHLIVLAPQLPRQLQAELMALPGRHLAGKKALIGVIGRIAALLAELLFDRDHLLIGTLRVAVDAGDKAHVLVADSFLLAAGVVKRLPEIGVLGLVRVARVIHQPLEAVTNRPYLRGCHGWGPHRRAGAYPKAFRSRYP